LEAERSEGERKEEAIGAQIEVEVEVDIAVEVE
jgi:hypothetical protein